MFSLLAFVPVSEGRPIAGPLLVILVLNGMLALGVVLLRRLTSLLLDPSKFIVIAALAILILSTF